MELVKVKDPTLRKLHNRGLQAIRYHDGEQNRHGWIVRKGQRGVLVVRLIGDERNRRLSASESRYVEVLT
jgi:hypothetical protein